MKTQKERFKEMTTDHLLTYRYEEFCEYPEKLDDEPDYLDDGTTPGYYINKELLYEELNKRPHRVRAKDRRTSKRYNK